jgi:hypothetical protein
MILLVYLFVVVSALVLVLTVGKMLACWYFKINERIDIENKILVELIKLNKDK